MLTLSVRGCGAGPLPYLLATGKRTFHGKRKELNKQEGATCKVAVLRRSLVLVGFWRFFLAEKPPFLEKKWSNQHFPARSACPRSASPRSGPESISLTGITHLSNCMTRKMPIRGATSQPNQGTHTERITSITLSIKSPHPTSVMVPLKPVSSDIS